jgi:hypothetical protein
MHSDVESFLAKQRKDNLAKGCLSRAAVLNVLEELEMQNYLNIEDDSMSTETIMICTASLIATITEDALPKKRYPGCPGRCSCFKR